MADSGPLPIRTDQADIGGQHWVFNEIDREDAFDYAFQVRGIMDSVLLAIEVRRTDLLAGSSAAAVEVSAALCKALPPALVKELRPKIFDHALVDGLGASKAIRDGKVTPGNAQAAFVRGLGLSFGPFGDADTGELVKSIGAVLATSKTQSSGAGTPSGGSSPPA